MSNKFFKKLRKEARAEVNRQFEDGVTTISFMIQRKPKYVPLFIWFLGYMIVFKKKYWKLIYKELNEK
jgi:hypothetical protein